MTDKPSTEPTANSSINVNGHDQGVQEHWIPNAEVAGTVRMLMRDQFDHERVCTLGRDRILFLDQELRLAHELLAEARDVIERGLSLMETVEAKTLVGDEGCLWPVELGREMVDRLKGFPRAEARRAQENATAGFAADAVTAAAELLSLSSERDRMAEALDRYRYAVEWVAADSWDHCSDCRARLAWARWSDGEAMDPNQTATIGQIFLAAEGRRAFAKMTAAAGRARPCEDCPPADYPTDKTRCAECPRRTSPSNEQP